MSKSHGNLQDTFLNQVRRDSVPVTVYLVNGVQLRGVVRGFDSFTLLLDNEGRQLMVYKHAVSTISPLKPVDLEQSGQQARCEPGGPPPVADR